MTKNEIIDTTPGRRRQKRKAASKNERDERSNSDQRKKFEEEVQTLRQSPREKEIQTTKTPLRGSSRKTK